MGWLTSLGKAEWSHSLGQIVDMIAAGKLFPPNPTVTIKVWHWLAHHHRSRLLLGTLGLMNLISFGTGPAPSIAPSQPVDIYIYIISNSTVVGFRKCWYHVKTMQKHKVSSLLWCFVANTVAQISRPRCAQQQAVTASQLHGNAKEVFQLGLRRCCRSFYQPQKRQNKVLTGALCQKHTIVYTKKIPSVYIINQCHILH